MLNEQDFFTSNNQACLLNLRLIDDTTGQTMLVQLQGISNQPVDYSILKTYENKGYIVNSENLPETATNGTFDVHLTHQVETDAVNVKIIRDVIYNFASNKEAEHNIVTKEVLCLRKTDKVTKNVSLDNNIVTFDEMDLPDINGYTPDQMGISKLTYEITPQDLTKGEKTITEYVNYTPLQVSLNMIFKDDISGEHKDRLYLGLMDSPVPTDYLQYVNKLEEQGYVPINVPKDLKFGDNKETVIHLSHKYNPIPDNDPALRMKKTRTIHYVKGLKEIATVKQECELSRTGTIDAVTGKRHYSKFSTGTFKKIPSKKFEGYAATKELSETEVTENTKNIDLQIHLSPLMRSIRFVLFDTAEENRLATVTITGKTDEALDLKKLQEQLNDLKKKHYLYDKPNIPKVMPPTNENITIPVRHEIVNYDGDYDDLKIVKTRTIAFKGDAKDLPENIVQKAIFTRHGKLDLVTGEKIFSDWSEPITLPSIVIPTIEGYSTVTQGLPSVTMTANSKNIYQDIIYVPDARHIKVVVKDITNGTIIDSHEANGEVGRAINLPLDDIRAQIDQMDYHIDNDETAGLTVYPVKAQKETFYINVSHKVQPITAENPINPVTGKDLSNQLEKIETYDIRYQTYTNHVLKQETLTKLYKRTGEVDMVTGNVVFDDYELISEQPLDPPNDGTYILEDANTELVPGTNILYMIPKEETVTITFKDQNDVIDTKNIVLKPNEVKSIGLTKYLNKGYAINTTNLDDHVAYDKAVLHRNITVMLHEVYDTKIERKVIKRQIVTMIDGDEKTSVTHTDEALITRQVDISKANPEHVRYGEWSKSYFGEYHLPTLPGYKLKTSVIPSEVVTSESKFEPIVLNYEKATLEAPKTPQKPALEASKEPALKASTKPALEASKTPRIVKRQLPKSKEKSEKRTKAGKVKQQDKVVTKDKQPKNAKDKQPEKKKRGFAGIFRNWLQ